MSNDEKTSNEIKVAFDMLEDAQRDYEAYKKLVALPFLPWIKKTPREPQTAIFHLQQSIEKIVKAVALASGCYVYPEVVSHGHDSFQLFIDMFVKFTHLRISVVFLKHVHGRIFVNQKAELFPYEQTLQKLTELKDKTQLEGPKKEMCEWSFELATLPSPPVKRLLKSQLKAISQAKRAKILIEHLPIKPLFRLSKNQGKKIYTYFDKALRNKGFLLMDQIREFFNDPEIKEIFDSKSSEQKMSLLKNAGSLMLSGIYFSGIYVMAALTFTHGVSPRYSGAPEDTRKKKLDSGSYSQRLGIAGCLIMAGKLNGKLLKISKSQVESLAGIFEVFGEDKIFTNPPSSV